MCFYCYVYVFLLYVYVFLLLCIICSFVICFIVLSRVFFVCKCVLYNWHRVSTQMYLSNISIYVYIYILYLPGPEDPATGYLGTDFLGFPVLVYKRMLRWFPGLQLATACFSCSPPDLNFLVPYFVLMYMHNNHCHRVTVQL